MVTRSFKFTEHEPDLEGDVVVIDTELMTRKVYRGSHEVGHEDFDSLEEMNEVLGTIEACIAQLLVEEI